MPLRVTGLPLNDALRTIESAGAVVAAVESAAPPADFRPRRTEQRAEAVYVATVWRDEAGAVNLRTVSVPAEPIKAVVRS
jgi:hypothetical protein